MIFVGLDLSLTSTGLVAGDLRVAHGSKFKGIERLVDLRTKILAPMAQFAADGQDFVVMVEGYSFGSKNSHAHALGELGGVIRMAMLENGFPFVEVPPSNVKKFATGKGNASKGEVMSATSVRTGIVWAGKGAEDICDAFVLEQMGLTKAGLSPYTWPKLNMEALDTLDWTNAGI